LRAFILFFTIITFSFGFIETRTHYNKMDVLNTLDIDRSFINSPLYLNYENSYKDVGQRIFFHAMDRGFAYVPLLKQKIQEAGIPDAFLYLAMAESGFSLKAYSSARASGLWQFIPQTGKMFGLEINEYVDERRDPVKSTEAAIAYLKHLHERFGKWYLVALAYNGGEGRLARAIEKAGSDKLEVLIDEEKKYLPKETRDYIKKIVQFTMIANNKELMLASNFDYLLNRGEAYSLAKVSVLGGESLKRVSELIRVKYSDLQLYNPHLKLGLTPPYAKSYDIYIPYMNLADFKAYYSSDDIQNFFVVHKVKRGDTIGMIADKYGISSKQVMQFNNLKNHIIYPNQNLVIPVPRENYQRLNPKMYEVQRGDSLFTIAKKFNTTIAKLKQLNNKTDNVLFIGEQIVVSN